MSSKIKKHEYKKTSFTVDAAFSNFSNEKNFLSSSSQILSTFSSSYKNNSSTNFSSTLNAILHKLINNISSPTNSKKVGCYTILETILKSHPDVLPQLINCMNEFEKKNEIMVSDKHHILGRILWYGAIIRSGSLYKSPSTVVEVVQKMDFLSTETDAKNQIVIGQFFVNLVQQYKSLDASSATWRLLEKKLVSEPKNMPLSLLWLRMILTQPKVASSLKPRPTDSFLEGTFDFKKHDYFIMFKVLFMKGVDIAAMLKDFFESLHYLADGNKKLEQFITGYMVPFIKKTEPTDSVIVFYITVSRIVLKFIDSKLATQMLCHKLWEAIFTKLNEKVLMVKASAWLLFDDLLKLVTKFYHEKNSESQCHLLEHILSTSAGLDFDRITGTTWLKQAVKFFCPNFVIQFSKMNWEKMGEKPTLNQVKGLSELISLRGHHEENYQSWRSEEAGRIMKLAFFTEWSKAERPLVVKYYCKALHDSKASFKDQVEMFEYQIEVAKGILKERNENYLESEMAKVEFQNVVKRIEESKKLEATHVILALRAISAGLGILLFIDEEVAAEMLGDVGECFKRAVNEAKKSKTNKKKKNKEEPSWQEVLMDLLVATLNSVTVDFAKDLIHAVFRNFCHCLEQSSLQVLLNAIKDDQEDESEQEEDDEEGEGESDEGEEDDNDDESDGEEEIDEEQLKKLKEKVINSMGDVTNAVDLDDASQEELDSLSQRLKLLFGGQKVSKKNKNAKMSEDDKEMVKFRIKLLKLCSIVVAEAPSASLVCQVAIALLRFATVMQHNGITHVISGILQSLSETRQFRSTDTLSVDQVLKNLEEVVRIGKTLRFDDKSLTSVVIFMLRSALLELPAKDQHQIQQWYERNFREAMPAHGVWVSIYERIDTLVGTAFDVLVDVAFSPKSNAEKRAFAITSLDKLFKTDRVFAKISAPIVHEKQKIICQNVVKIFSSIEERPINHVEKTVVVFLQTLAVIHRKSSDWKSSFDWESVSDALEAFKNRPVDDKNKKKEIQKAVLLMKNIDQLPAGLKKKNKKRKLCDEDEGIAAPSTNMLKEDEQIFRFSMLNKSNEIDDEIVIENKSKKVKKENKKEIKLPQNKSKFNKGKKDKENLLNFEMITEVKEKKKSKKQKSPQKNKSSKNGPKVKKMTNK